MKHLDDVNYAPLRMKYLVSPCLIAASPTRGLPNSLHTLGHGLFQCLPRPIIRLLRG